MTATPSTVRNLPVVNEELVRGFIDKTIRENIHLVAILPDGLPIGASFGAEADKATAWAIAQNQRGYGVYWTVNIVRARLNKKPQKADIAAARFLHVDIDPPFDRSATIANLAAARHAASFVINSGNGLQAFWRLDYPAENLNAVEDLNRRIAAVFGGDHCHNIDRLMRLPGTINYPNKLKAARGRIPMLATVVEDDAGESVDPLAMDADLPALPPEQRAKREAVHVEGLELLGVQELKIPLNSTLRGLITQPPNPDRSAATYAAVCEMVMKGFNDQAIAGVLLNPDLTISGHCLDQLNPLRAVQRVIGAVRAKAKVQGSACDAQAEGSLDSFTHEAPAGDGAQRPGRRPIIEVKAGALHTIATEAESALIDGDAPLFVRGGLVRPIVDDMPAAHGRRTKVARLAPVDAAMLIDHLSRCADWVRFNIRKQGLVAANPPRDVAATILSRDGEWRFRKLAGVLTTPTLRPDGTILSEPGYDAATELLLLDPPQLPSISDRPTKEEAQQALTVLNTLLDEFPFSDEPSRAVALSALVTPVVRGAMSVAPLHATTAPVAGSGKSYIIDLASAIATGERAPVIATGQSEEELEKRLGAALLSGQSIVNIDNVNGRLGGDALCQMIERPVVTVRPLGLSKLIKVESRATCFATGNNIQLLGDMTRRGLLCSLDPNVERPELRVFRRNPFDQVLDDRGKYVAAALTIVRAYRAAGCPSDLPPLASFEEWSRTVRSALVWLGVSDPCATMDKARADDPVITQLTCLLEAWHDAVDTAARTAGAIVEKARTTNTFNQRLHSELYQALLEVAEDRRGDVSTARLGRYLARHRGRIVKGLKLVAVEDKHAKQAVWRVQKL